METVLRGLALSEISGDSANVEFPLALKPRLADLIEFFNVGACFVSDAVRINTGSFAGARTLNKSIMFFGIALDSFMNHMSFTWRMV